MVFERILETETEFVLIKSPSFESGPTYPKNDFSKCIFITGPPLSTPLVPTTVCKLLFLSIIIPIYVSIDTKYHHINKISDPRHLKSQKSVVNRKNYHTSQMRAKLLQPTHILKLISSNTWRCYRLGTIAPYDVLKTMVMMMMIAYTIVIHYIIIYRA